MGHAHSMPGEDKECNIKVVGKPEGNYRTAKHDWKDNIKNHL
jgi:hypothetical protein